VKLLDIIFGRYTPVEPTIPERILLNMTESFRLADSLEKDAKELRRLVQEERKKT
jgi:hypothetical protein